MALAQLQPGLEDLLVDELVALGVPCKAMEAGVTFAATPDHLTRVHQGSWIASRVWVRIGTFPARSLAELAAGVRTLAWRAVAVSRQAIEVDVVTRSSRLARRDAIEAKVAHAIQDALRGTGRSATRPPERPVRLLVRIVDDQVTISVDASGDLLHRRGWRMATAKAPLRENLAAAVLAAAGWRHDEPLVDAFCGAGTFPIEAARQAMGLGPRLHSHYAFHDWPSVGPQPASRRGPARLKVGIHGSDRDAGAVQASRDNARRAHVGDAITWSDVAFEERRPPEGGRGLLIGNLPWGLRVSEGAQLTRVYSRWGEALRDRWSGWRAAFLVSDPRLLPRLHPGAQVVRTFSEGGVRVSLGVISDV